MYSVEGLEWWSVSNSFQMPFIRFLYHTLIDVNSFLIISLIVSYLVMIIVTLTNVIMPMCLRLKNFLI